MSGEQFTVAEVARVLGCSKQTVHKRLVSISADGAKVVRGNLAKTWKTNSLPPGLSCKLENVRARKGYTTIEDLLQRPFRRFALRVPLAQINHSVVQTARKRQHAFREVIPLRND